MMTKTNKTAAAARALIAARTRSAVRAAYSALDRALDEDGIDLASVRTDMDLDRIFPPGVGIRDASGIAVSFWGRCPSCFGEFYFGAPGGGPPRISPVLTGPCEECSAARAARR